MHDWIMKYYDQYDIVFVYFLVCHPYILLHFFIFLLEIKCKIGVWYICKAKKKNDGIVKVLSADVGLFKVSTDQVITW